MAIVGLFTYRQYVIYIRTIRKSRNVKSSEFALQSAEVRCNRMVRA